MATIEEHLERVKKMNNLKEVLFDYIKKIENNFTALNKEQLFYHSSDIYGNPIGFYSRATEEITGGEKQEGEPFTAVDTGDFFKGFFIKREGDKIRFGSTDPKTDEILNSKHWLSHDLFGLTEQNLKEVIEQSIYPFVINESRKALQL